MNVSVVAILLWGISCIDRVFRYETFCLMAVICTYFTFHFILFYLLFFFWGGGGGGLRRFQHCTGHITTGS